MGSYRTKEDDVARISTSVYITNFPESVSAKELFHACKQYGHVVDSFIPTKRSKNGKRFGFVRFINVFNEERLVNNLCTVWVDRYKLHANIARFQRPPDKKEGDGVKKTNAFSSHKEYSKGVKQVKVMLEFNSEETINKFRDNVSVASWFSQIIEATTDFEIEGRIAWVEVEGIPFKLWSGNTFSRIATKWGKLLDVDDQEETCFHSKRLCIYMKSGRSIVEEFKIIHRGKIYWIRANETPGWVPDFTDESDDDDQDEINSNDDDIDIQY
ncbi:nucleotide-binding alpha-beta plait domain-containing protein [Tanacetum coccineum]